jgi:hypothetical protein
LNNEIEHRGEQVDTATLQNNPSPTGESNETSVGNQKAANKEASSNRIREWLSKENMEEATETREEIFDAFDNDLAPVAVMDERYLPYLGEGITDSCVYSHGGYSIDHVVNNYSNISLSKYDNIQDILDNPDGVKYRHEKKKAISRVHKEIRQTWGQLLLVPT